MLIVNPLTAPGMKMFAQMRVRAGQRDGLHESGSVVNQGQAGSLATQENTPVCEYEDTGSGNVDNQTSILKFCRSQGQPQALTINSWFWQASQGDLRPLAGFAPQTLSLRL